MASERALTGIGEQLDLFVDDLSEWERENWTLRRAARFVKNCSEKTGRDCSDGR